jgi:hypothetical protein
MGTRKGRVAGEIEWRALPAVPLVTWLVILSSGSWACEVCDCCALLLWCLIEDLTGVVVSRRIATVRERGAEDAARRGDDDLVA